MTISKTGSTLTFSNTSASPSPESISVPGDAELIVFMWSYWSSDGSAITSITLNSVALTVDSQLPVVGLANAVGIAHLIAPATGTQNLQWAMSGDSSISDGPVIQVMFFKSDVADTFLIRDSQVDQTDAQASTAEITLDTEISDTVIVFAQAYIHDPVVNISGTYLDTTYFNNSDEGASYLPPPDSGSSYYSNTEDYASIVAISFYDQIPDPGFSLFGLNFSP